MKRSNRKSQSGYVLLFMVLALMGIAGVVGAGFTGVATALTLAERGYSVALIEANRVGWGASGRNGGQLINGIGGLEKIRKKHGEGIADMLWDMKWRGNDIVYDRVEKYGIDCDLKSGFVETA